MARLQLFVLHSSSGKTSLTRFVGYATHCTWEEAQTILDSVKTDHPKSRHVCFGYMSGDTERSSDDGEPSGTAGAPILNAIKGENLQTHYAKWYDTLVVSNWERVVQSAPTVVQLD